MLTPIYIKDNKIGFAFNDRSSTVASGEETVDSFKNNKMAAEKDEDVLMAIAQKGNDK